MYLEVKNLAKFYNSSYPIIKDLTFSVKKGELISFLGESGSGKTTLCSKIASYILDNKFSGNERHKLSIVNFAPISTNHSELLNFGRLLNLNVNNISNLEDLITFVEANKENNKFVEAISIPETNIALITPERMANKPPNKVKITVVTHPRPFEYREISDLVKPISL